MQAVQMDKENTVAGISDALVGMKPGKQGLFVCTITGW